MINAGRLSCPPWRQDKPHISCQCRAGRSWNKHCQSISRAPPAACEEQASDSSSLSDLASHTEISTPARTHTHTHIHTHIQTNTSMHRQIQSHVSMKATPIHTHRQTLTHTHRRTDRHTDTQTDTQTDCMCRPVVRVICLSSWCNDLIPPSAAVKGRCIWLSCNKMAAPPHTHTYTYTHTHSPIYTRKHTTFTYSHPHILSLNHC